MKSADAGGELWMDDVTINGVTEDFAVDPGWDGSGNRRAYVSADVRPRFDFGFSPTAHAGGRARGELGGLVFRGDCRDPAKMACYGDRLGALGFAGCAAIFAGIVVAEPAAASTLKRLVGRPAPEPGPLPPG